MSDARCRRFHGVNYNELEEQTLKAGRMKRLWNGVSSTADAPAKRKSRSGMRFLPSVDGEMTRAQTCKQLRSDEVSAIATTSKPGWICTTPKKAEPRGRVTAADK